MAVEGERGCGFRKVGSLYLEGAYASIGCDRLPMPLEICPICGGGIKVSRGFTRINPLQLWGFHAPCSDTFHPCFVCDPGEDPAFIMLVGEGYYKTPGDFAREAEIMGISKKIPFVPKDMVIGKTVVYLAHHKACEVREAPAMQHAMAIGAAEQEDRPRLLDAEAVKMATGIFSAFIPQRIVQIVKESSLEGPAGDKLCEDLAKRGITPIPVPDDDPDHAAPGHTRGDED